MEELNVEDVINDLINSINDKIKCLQKLNLIVVGRTGVGKSTLINTVFKEKFAQTGVGKPITSKIRQYTKPGYPLTIYDTPGFEMSEEQRKNVIDEIQKIIDNCNDPTNVNEYIHCLWYCINPNTSRIDPVEEKWLKSLTDTQVIKRVPIIIVLTQASIKTKAEELKKEIEKLNLNISNIVPVLACKQAIDKEYTAKPYGLETLIKTTFNIIPKYLHETLNHIQVVSLDMKVSASRNAVIAAASSAAAIAAAPIPFSDAALLIPIQITMIAAITCYFGIDVSKAVLTSLITSALGTTATTLLGKQIVINLIKLIPGVGTVVGGAINATTAATLTTTLGEAYIQIMKMLYNGTITSDELETEKGRQLFIEAFKEQSKKALPK